MHLQKWIQTSIKIVCLTLLQDRSSSSAEPTLMGIGMCDDKWRVMMIKDILVMLPAGDAPSSVLDYAVTLARAFDAHLTGVAFV